ncbi:MAG: hypothetical protein IJ088_12940 [Clostridia bacterium]|nr:hypothetical protein [Clostridia bacterium]
MINVYELCFRRNETERIEEECDRYLYKRMAELVKIRNGIMEESFFTEFENQFIVPQLKDSRGEEYSHPPQHYIYYDKLLALSSICTVMRYKLICFYRYQSAFDSDREMYPILEEIIRDAIIGKKEITYRELIEIDLEQDIPIVLEHMIETSQVIESGRKGRRICLSSMRAQKRKAMAEAGNSIQGYD